MNRFRNAFTVAIVALLGLWAVNATAAEGTAIKGDGGTIRLLLNQSGTQSFPPYVIRKLNLDQKYGFKLETVPATSTQSTTTGFQTGSAEIGMYGWNDLSRVKAGGVKVVGIAPFMGWANTVVLPIDSPIKNLGDVKGKKFGIYSRTSLDTVVMRALAQGKYKFDFEQSIVMQEASIPLLRGFMEQKQLDVSQMWNDQTAPMVVSGNFRVLATIRDFGDELGVPETPLLLYAVDTDYAAAHPNNVKAYLAAYREAIAYLESDDSAWFERGKELNMNDEPTIVALRNQTRPMLMSRFKPTTEADIRKTWSVLLATAGAEKLGMSDLIPGFMTLEYQ